MSTFVNENEMNTKIHIAFVSTVGKHPSSGDWRHRADRVSYYMLYSEIPYKYRKKIIIKQRNYPALKYLHNGNPSEAYNKENN